MKPISSARIHKSERKGNRETNEETNPISPFPSRRVEGNGRPLLQIRCIGLMDLCIDEVYNKCHKYTVYAIYIYIIYINRSYNLIPINYIFIFLYYSRGEYIESS